MAIVDETPPGQTIHVGSERVHVSQYAEQLFSQVQAVPVSSRAQAIAEIKSGDVLAAVVIPRDIAARISSGVTQAQHGSPLQRRRPGAVARAVRSTRRSRRRTSRFSKQIQRAAAQAIGVLLHGGNLGVLGAPANLVGLETDPVAVALDHRATAARRPTRTQLERIDAFAEFAAQNLGLSRNVLSTIGQPIQVHSTLLHGRRTPLNTFAVVVAVSVSLMFVCVLLAAGGVALEREEHTLARLARGVWSARGAARREAAAGRCLRVRARLGDARRHRRVRAPRLESRIGLWLIALACGAVAFGALGMAIGALAREVRAASLLAFLLSLPLAFLALVPSGSVSRGLYDAIGTISFVFPFKAALQALDAAVNGASPGLGVSSVHLRRADRRVRRARARGCGGLRRLD